MGAEKLELADIIGSKKTIQLIGNISGGPDYNTAAFPATVEHWAKELQRVYNIDVAYTLTSAIVAAGTLIGNKYVAKIKSTHTATANFFALLVGQSGAAKSPAMQYAFEHLIKNDVHSHKEHKLKVEDYNQRKAQAEAAKAEFTEQPPVNLNRYVFQDTTTEALYKHLETSFNGTVFFVDEYMNFHNNVINSRYGNGNDRGKVLSWIDCKPIFVDTKKEGTKLIERSHISILAGTQPDRLPEIIGNISDGLTERFLYAYNSRPFKAMSFDTVDDSVIYHYNNTMQKLIELDFHYNQFGEVEPLQIPFTETAFAQYLAYSEQLADRVRESETELSRTVITKMQNFCPRLALVLQMLYYACNEDVNTYIGDRAINGAIQLMDYYIASSLKAHGEARQTDPTKKLTTEQYKIYNALPDEFTTADGIDIAARFGMTDPTKAKRFFSGKKELFERVKHGHYEKRY